MGDPKFGVVPWHVLQLFCKTAATLHGMSEVAADPFEEDVAPPPPVDPVVPLVPPAAEPPVGVP
jgi:hypothetical protein